MYSSSGYQKPAANNGGSTTFCEAENTFCSPFEDEDGDAEELSPFAVADVAFSSKSADSNDWLRTSATSARDVLEGQPTSESLYDIGSFCSEMSRLEALDSCAMLHTAPEAKFDVITTLFAGMLDFPVCVVSLVAADMGWFKSNFGPFQGCVKREGSFCSYIVVPDFAEVLVVEDCTKDARFSNNPFVAGPPDLRFYAGCPLVTTTGYRIGTLCLCDFRPRRLPATAYNLMCNMAEIIAREVEHDVIAKELGNNQQGVCLHGAGGGEACELCPPPLVPASREPVFVVNTADPSWPLVYGNAVLEEVLDVDSVHGAPFWDLFGADDVAAEVARLMASVDADERAVLRAHLAGEEGGDRACFEMQFCSATRSRLKNSVPVGIPGFIAVDESVSEDTSAYAFPLNALWIATIRVVKPSRRLRGLETASSVGSQFSTRSAYAPVAGTKPHPLAALQLGPLLGQGAFGKVYRGSLKEKSVAIKVMDLTMVVKPAGHGSGPGSALSGGCDSGPEGASSAIMEAVLSRHLAHPNIVPTLDFVVNYEGGVAQTMWIVQHLCDRGSLYDIIERGLLRETPSLSAPPSLPNILDTALDIASALEHLHEEDVLHCDLSGNNVLLSSAANARGFVALVSDFGLSQAFKGNVRTQTLGTVTHMAPEVLMDGAPNKSTDVYSFGILLWEMWNGRRAWAGANPANIIFQVTIQNKQLVMPDDCPEAVHALATSCMHLDPALRPTFSEIVATLKELRAV